MSVSSSNRKIFVGSVRIGVHGTADDDSIPSIGDLADDIVEHINGNDTYRYYANDEQVMWCSHFRKSNGYCQMIIQVGDRDVADLSRMNFKTQKTWDIPKTSDDEGSHHSAHVLISEVADNFGDYMILIESVPGVNITTVKDHLTWIFQNERYYKDVKKGDKEKHLRVIFKISGYESMTLRKVIQEGTLEDIEVVWRENLSEGHDEEFLQQEVEHTVKVSLQRKISDSDVPLVDKLYNKLSNKVPRHLVKERALVRVKSKNEKQKSVMIRKDIQNALGETFIFSEYVSGFSENPLTQSYYEFRDDLIAKIIDVANKVREENVDS